jgi:hypothetical protein
LGIPSQAFETKRHIEPRSGCMVFEQTAGARTVSPEVIGQFVGGAVPIVVAPPGVGWQISPITRKIGRAVAHEFSGFPPIWTRLRLTVFPDGRSEGQVLSYSLFPSMSFYVLTVAAAATAGGSATSAMRADRTFYDLSGAPYDARPNLDRWKTEGWGELQAKPSGACRGNPWGYSKNDLTRRPTRTDTRII